MDQIDVVDQKGNITNFGTRFLLPLHGSSLRTNPFKIESNLFHIKNAKGIPHKFLLEVCEVKNESGKSNYELKIKFFCHVDDEAHSDFKFFCIICDKYGKKINVLGFKSMPVQLMSKESFVNWNFMYENRPLTLHFYIFHHIPIFDKSLETDTCESLCFSGGKLNPSNECKFLSDISKLYTNSELSDFKILTKDKTFNVHKVVLAARSTVFAEYFKENQNNNASEQRKNDFELTIDVSAKIVEEMLRYIYTDSVNDLDELAIDLYKIGKQYNLAGLQKKCVSNLIKKISVENCRSLLQFAQKYNIESLYDKVLVFFTEHTNEVLSNSATDELLKSFYDLKLSLENPDLLKE